MSNAAWFQETFSRIQSELAKVIVGQEEIVRNVLVGLAANGHVLLEGMPGLGKTLTVRSLAQCLSLNFSRIQFTPDMMPADVTGTNIFVQTPEGGRNFEFRHGPIFANIVLADEINRATPKTQSALLEAMQERSVTIGGKRMQLDEPFLVMATQNPIEQEGTYSLPEAQLDRFFFKLLVPDPTKADLAEVVKRTTGTIEPQVQPVATKEEILRMRHVAREVPIAESVLDFGLNLIVATRPNESKVPAVQKYLRYGSSPRGAQCLVTAARIFALLDGRFNVSKEDLKQASLPVLRHRIGLNFEAEADSITQDKIISDVILGVERQDRDPIRV